MRPLIPSLQDKVTEVNFGLKEVERIIRIYNKTHEKGDE